jgi:hypothetical protein
MSQAPDTPQADAAVPAADQPRIVEEHHIVGHYGEDEIEAVDNRGRRWYHVRPERRTRADVFGFNYTWWLVLLLIVVVALLPW